MKTFVKFWYLQTHGAELSRSWPSLSYPRNFSPFTECAISLLCL